MHCSYCKDEMCTNPECQMRGDYCPVPDTPGVCKYEKLSDPLIEATEKAYRNGAEAMRSAAIQKILELEKDCLGIQKAVFVVTRDAIRQLEVPK